MTVNPTRLFNFLTRITFIFAFNLCLTVNAQAGLSSLLTNMDMSKILGASSMRDSGGKVKHNGKTTHSFGAVSVRFVPAKPKNLINFRPPKVGASCAGIDMFLGSINIMSKDEMIAALRAVAQGVGVYAFNLAMSSLCADCSAIMQDIQARMEELNKWAKTSCEDTVKMLNDVGKPNPGGLVSVAKTTGGIVDSTKGSWLDNDWFAEDSWYDQVKSSLGGTDDKVNKESLKNAYGNLTWNAIRSVDMNGWTFLAGWSMSKTQMLMQSMLGTMIIDASSENGDKDFDYEAKASTVTLSDLIYGDKEHAGTLFLLECDPSAQGGMDDCTTLKVPANDEKGMKHDFISINDQVMNMMIGKKNSAGVREGGIRSKLRTKTGLSDDEIAFMRGSPVRVDKVLFLRTMDKSSSEELKYHSEIAKVVATQITLAIGDSLLDLCVRIIATLESDKDFAESTKKAFEDRMKTLKSEMTLIREKTASEFDSYVKLAGLKDNLVAKQHLWGK